MPFMSSNQKCQSTEGLHSMDLLTQAHLGSSNFVSDHQQRLRRQCLRLPPTASEGSASECIRVPPASRINGDNRTRTSIIRHWITGLQWSPVATGSQLNDVKHQSLDYGTTATLVDQQIGWRPTNNGQVKQVNHGHKDNGTRRSA